MKSILLFAALSFALAACGNKEPASSVQAVRPALTQVVGAQAEDGDNVYSGEVRARHEVALGFRTGGKITELPVQAGARVVAGQVLARIDAADAGLQAGAAQAQFKLAESEAMRYRELHSRGFVSRSALDGKEATLMAARAQAGLMRNQSDYTTLRAGHDGVIVATLAEAGQVVSAGLPVVRLAESGELEVAIEIPEAQFAARRVNEAAEVVLLAGDGAPLSGRLRELSLSADPASRTYPARVAFRAQAIPDVQAALGMTARVRFENQSKASSELLIPLTAVFQQGLQTAVWIVAADHSVSLRQVKIKAYRDNGAVVASGLSAGERIISAGVHRLTAGEKIQLIEAAR